MRAIRILSALAGAFLGVMSVSSTASAQAWPTKPIRWVVPFTPGGMTDIVTRGTLDRVSEQTGWKFVVEYKPGANATIGAAEVARAAPDGYTFMTVIGGHAANATLYAGRLSFDPAKSFTAVTLVGQSPLIIVARPGLPANDIGELIAYAKANPGKVSFGSSGVGALSHLSGERLKQMAGIDMVHVPYKGFAASVQDLLSDNLDIVFDTPPSVMSYVRSGKLKALGLLAEKRVAAAPEVPTITEGGGPRLEVATPILLLAPAGTPANIVDRLSSEVVKALASPELVARFATLGVEIAGTTPDQARRFLDDEIARWGEVIRRANVKID